MLRSVSKRRAKVTSAETCADACHLPFDLPVVWCAKNDQFVHEARENAFELFMRPMNDTHHRAFFGLSRAPCTSFSGAHKLNLAARVVQAATALIADTATERG